MLEVLFEGPLTMVPVADPGPGAELYDHRGALVIF
jgi:hypothetical protein